jgi:hypothetical protein
MKLNVAWVFCLFLLVNFCQMSVAQPLTATDNIVTIDLTALNRMQVNTGNAKAVWDPLHTLATLQGIVNRQSPRLYLFYIENAGINIDRYWWDKYRQEGKWLEKATVTQCRDMVELVTLFKKEIAGAVVYDPNVAATSNVASSIAGVDNLIAVRYDADPNSLYSKLILNGPQIEVKVWLVNEDGSSLFTGVGVVPGTDRASSGSTKVDAYLWFIEHYMKKGKCNTAYGGYYIDQFWLTKPTNAERNHHTLTNHDFFVSKKGFFFDLSPWTDEKATDDPSQTLGKDSEILKEMLLIAYQQNNNGNQFAYLGGFPPWPCKYTTYGGAGGKHGEVETEWEYARIISAYNAFKDADAANLGALANASFWQHFPLKASYPQHWVTHEELKAKGFLDSNGKLTLGDKQLFVFYVGDYDASSWLSQITPTIWDDPNRGQVPMMWSISPVLSERVPMAWEYRLETATPNDYFVAADNGAGYLLPGMLQAPRPVSGLPDGTAAWAEHCKPFYEKWGITVTGFIIDGTAPGLNEAGLDAYASFSPNGIVPQKSPGNSLASLHGDMPILQSVWDVNQDDPKVAAAEVVTRVNARAKNIPFHWFRNILKSPQWYVQVNNELKNTNSNIVLVEAPVFFELLRIYLKEKLAEEKKPVLQKLRINNRSVDVSDTIKNTVTCNEDEVTFFPTISQYCTYTVLVDGKPATTPFAIKQGMNRFVIRVIPEEGMLPKDYFIEIIHPLDIVRPYYDKVLAVNLNTTTNGGYTFSGFQWKKNGKDIQGETAAYLSLSSIPLSIDEFNVILTTDDGQVFPTCSKQWIQYQKKDPETVLKAYPNPAQTDITVENEDWEESSSLILYDKNGKKMQTYPLTGIQTRINVSNCVPGIYILQTGSQSAKIIVNK